MYKQGKRTMSKQLNIELFCGACDEERVMTMEDYKKCKRIQGNFKDEWATEDICLRCAKSHSCNDGAYWDEDDEKDFKKKFRDYIERGYKFNSVSEMWLTPNDLFWDEDWVRRNKAMKNK
jgi:hypothetical protein